MTINILKDDNNVIIGFATLGSIVGGVDIKTNYKNAEEVPSLSIGYYKLIDGQIVVDEELKAQFEATQ